MQNTKQYTLALTLEEIIQLGQCAAERPYREVAQLLHKIEVQVNAQAAKAAEAEPDLTESSHVVE